MKFNRSYIYKLTYVFNDKEFNGYFKTYAEIAAHLGISTTSVMMFATGRCNYIRKSRVRSIDIIKIKKSAIDYEL